MIHANFIGRLVADPVMDEKKTAIRVAVDGRKDKDGNKHSDFVSCVAFGKTAEFAGKLVKGQAVFLTGTMQTREYKGKDNQIHTSLDMAIDSIEVVTWPDKEEKKPEQTKLPWD